jgi:hypothetical protein
MSWCSHSSTCIIHLLLTFLPLLLTVFIFSFQGLNPIKIDCPHSLALRAFSHLGFIASLRVRWLMQLSSANHTHSSHQARGDLTWMNLVLPRSYTGGNKKNRSHSQMSIQHANNKNKLVDFAVVSGWTALAGRWCSASLACFSTELQVYLNSQWRELFELQVMMHHGLVAPLLPRIMCAEICTESELPCYSIFCMVSNFIVYISFLYLSLDFKALLVAFWWDVSPSCESVRFFEHLSFIRVTSPNTRSDLTKLLRTHSTRPVCSAQSSSSRLGVALGFGIYSSSPPPFPSTPNLARKSKYKAKGGWAGT